MRVAVVILGNLWVAPYVNTYKDILDNLGVECDVFSWDRDGSDAVSDTVFSSYGIDLSSGFTKFRYYIKYSAFIKKTIKERNYDRIIVSGPHLAILLSSFLIGEYKERYIIDYRDLAVEQYPILWQCFDKVLANSFCNVVSSPGFCAYLPKRHSYIVSHNFNVNNIMGDDYAVPAPVFDGSVPLRILTIGYIRNYSSNVKVLASLANKSGYELHFVGTGDAPAMLQKFALEHSVSNVSFSGFYKKEKEREIVDSCSFINIFFPTDAKHATIMSNRFYLALLYKRPVIVTEGSTQAVFVKEYNLGVVVSDCSNLDELIKLYLKNFNYKDFCERCDALLERFLSDYRLLEKRVAELVKVGL